MLRRCRPASIARLLLLFGVCLTFVGASTNPIHRWDYTLRSQMPLVIFSDEAGQLDAFGRLRTSMPQTIFDSKVIFDKDSLFWSERVANHSGQAASVLTVPNWRFTVGENDTIVRQTRTWWNYQPGKSQLVMMTAALDTVAGLKSRLGQFNDHNGIFFELQGSRLHVGFRSDGVDSLVVDTAFNRDHLDGSGVSKIKIDYTKAQNYWICYEWLGAGSVAYGVVVEGIMVICHLWDHANANPVTYTRTPNLPLRFEATKTSAGTATINTICATVSSEAGAQVNGLVRSASNNGAAGHLDADKIDTAYCALAMKLNPAKLGTTVRLEDVSLVSTSPITDGEWFLAINPTILGSLNFVAEPNSSIMVARGTGSNVVLNNGLGRIGGGLMSQATRQSMMSVPASSAGWALGCKVDTTQADTLALCFRPASANADILAAWTWRELR